MLLKAPRLALRPARLGMSLFFVVLLTLCVRIPDLWTEKGRGIGESIGAKWPRITDGFVGAVRDLSPVKAMDSLHALFVSLPLAIWNEQRWYSVLAAFLPVVALWAIFSGAISRSAAEDYLRSDRRPWTHYLSFSLARPLSLIFAYVGPLLFAGVLCLVVAVVGLALRIPFVQVGVAAFGFLAILVALAVVVMLCGLCLGFPMITPAVVCEGTDAIDANQRALAYVFGRPVRFLSYLGLLIVLMVVCGAVVAYFVSASLDLGASVVTGFVGRPNSGYLYYYMIQGEEYLSAGDVSASLKTTGKVLAFWAGAWKLLVPAYLFSLFNCGGTILYFLARLVNDGQEPGELWRGSNVPAVLRRAESDASNAAAADDT